MHGPLNVKFYISYFGNITVTSRNKPSEDFCELCVQVGPPRARSDPGGGNNKIHFAVPREDGELKIFVLNRKE